MRRSLSLLAVLAASQAATAAGPKDCEALSAPGLFPNTRVTAARVVPADAEGRFPEHCEVTAVITPAPGSRIGVVYRMPQQWNGKMLGTGGGGWAGNVKLIDALANLDSASAMKRGFATGQTDGGHESTDVSNTEWSANPESVVDFAHRAVHLMTSTGKSVIAKYYGRAHSRAYFVGCSTGGRQGLMEVQRYPNDYDGVVSGAPVYSLVTQTNALVRRRAMIESGAKLTPAQLDRLNAAALAECDATDGLKDGIITDPRTCKFDPQVLQCPSGAAGDECLTPQQVSGIRALYAGARTADGRVAAYPITRGGERGWGSFVTAVPPTRGEGADGGLLDLRQALFGDPDFDLMAFEPDRDLKTVRSSAFANLYEADDPDISAFVNKGGKLLLWHGWDDPGPSAAATIDYYEDVRRVTAPKTKSLDSSVRFFLAPGVYHCRGGPGADKLDLVDIIDRWVETNTAPDTILARKAESPMTRPLCPYPTLPRYKGTGDPNSAASFECKAPATS